MAVAAKLRAVDLITALLVGVNQIGIRIPGMASCVTRIAMTLNEWMTSFELM